MAGGLGGGAEQRSLSVSHKLGSEKSHGTPSKDERREGGGGGAAVRCFSPSSSLAHVFSYPLRGPLSGRH